jgi:hypothetical protein
MPAPSDATDDETTRIENALHIKLPSRQELSEIEFSMNLAAHCSLKPVERRPIRPRQNHVQIPPSTLIHPLPLLLPLSLVRRTETGVGTTVDKPAGNADQKQ